MSKTIIIKEKYPELSVSLFDIIDSMDNTNTKKYLEVYCKIVSNFISENYENEVNEPKKSMISFLVKSLEKKGVTVLKELDVFLENNENKLNENNNIQTYSTIDQIVEENKRTETEKKLRALQNDITRHYDDNEFVIIEPLTFEASKKYGYGTKWCTTMSFSRFSSYVGSEKRLIYIINKTKNYKIAIYSLKGIIQYWTETNDNKDVFELIHEGLLTVDIAKEIHNIVSTTTGKIKKESVVEKNAKWISNEMQVMQNFGYHDPDEEPSIARLNHPTRLNKTYNGSDELKKFMDKYGKKRL